MPTKSDVYEFFVEGKNHQLSHVLLHIASPGKPDGEQQGYFFVLVEMERPQGEILGMVEDLIKDGENLYYTGYETEIENIKDRDTKHFESVIEKLNRQTKSLLGALDGRKIHMAVGAIVGDKISCAYRGDITALLAYTTPEGPSFTTIIDETSYPEHIFFSSVIEGNFTTEESVYLSTPHITKYFSPDRIAKMIVGKPAKQASQQIQKTLEGISSEYSFGGIVITGVEVKEFVRAEKYTYKPEIGSEASMEKLLDTTRTTEDTLSPRVFSHLAKSLSGRRSKNIDESNEEEISTIHATRETRPGKYRRKKRQPLNPEDGSSILILLGKAIVWCIKALWYVLKTLALGLGKSIAIIWSLLTNYNGSRKILIDQYKESYNRIISRITSLGMFGKILLLILIIGIGILIGSVLYMKDKEEKAAIENAYQEKMTEISATYKEAESYLLYGQNSKALESVRSTKEQLSALTHETEEKQKRATEISTELDELLLKIQKITIIEPEKITDIQEFHTAPKTDSIVIMEDRIIATGKEDSSLYFISTLTGLVEKKSAETAGKLANGYVAKDATVAVFTSGNNSIVSYDKSTDSIISKTITYPNPTVTLADIGLYNGRLYTIDQSSGAIYRHNPTQIGYDTGATWVTSITDQSILKKSVSFAIDGDLYILTSDGKVKKFTAGEEQVFTVTGLDPQFESPTTIETRSEFSNIYILEPAKKRIVILDKSGNFKKQFTTSEWNNPTGLAIRADEKEAYVLDGTVIYKFKL
jgi:hypothetical protein